MAETSLNSALLNIEQLAVSFGSRNILNGLSLSVRRGERIAVLGRSGCGKSTLLRAIASLEAPTSGKMMYDGVIYWPNKSDCNIDAIRGEFGLVFQGFNLFPNLTIRRNISIALERVKRLSKAEARAITESIAVRFGIEEVLDRYMEAVSGGQAQRAALCRTLVLKPSVLLLDEVTSALDPETTGEMIDAIEEAWLLEREFEGGQDGRCAVIIVTHNFEFARRFADRIAFLADGRIVENHLSKDFSHLASHEEAIRYLKCVVGQPAQATGRAAVPPSQ
jgi:polar amino acid transport system ATP-binding protein